MSDMTLEEICEFLDSALDEEGMVRKPVVDDFPIALSIIRQLLPDARRMEWLATSENFHDFARRWDSEGKEIVFLLRGKAYPTPAKAIDSAMKEEGK